MASLVVYKYNTIKLYSVLYTQCFILHLVDNVPHDIIMTSFDKYDIMTIVAALIYITLPWKGCGHYE